jgi:hypothetical protein
MVLNVYVINLKRIIFKDRLSTLVSKLQTYSELVIV